MTVTAGIQIGMPDTGAIVTGAGWAAPASENSGTSFRSSWTLLLQALGANPEQQSGQGAAANGQALSDVETVKTGKKPAPNASGAGKSAMPDSKTLPAVTTDDPKVRAKKDTPATVRAERPAKTKDAAKSTEANMASALATINAQMPPAASAPVQAVASRSDDVIKPSSTSETDSFSPTSSILSSPFMAKSAEMVDNTPSSDAEPLKPVAVSADNALPAPSVPAGPEAALPASNPLAAAPGFEAAQGTSLDSGHIPHRPQMVRASWGQGEAHGAEPDRRIDIGRENRADTVRGSSPAQTGTTEDPESPRVSLAANVDMAAPNGRSTGKYGRHEDVAKRTPDDLGLAKHSDAAPTHEMTQKSDTPAPSAPPKQTEASRDADGKSARSVEPAKAAAVHRPSKEAAGGGELRGVAVGQDTFSATQVRNPGGLSPAAIERQAGTAMRSPAHGTDTFAALDAGVTTPPATWVHAGAHHAEAGYLDPSLGWVGVRADTVGNTVHAAVVPGSAQAAETLGTHLAGLNAYMAEHHSQTTVTLAGTQDGQTGSGMGQGSNANDGNRGYAGTGQGRERFDRAPAASAASQDSPAAASAPGGLSPWTGAARTSGAHISVMA